MSFTKSSNSSAMFQHETNKVFCFNRKQTKYFVHFILNECVGSFRVAMYKSFCRFELICSHNILQSYLFKRPKNREDSSDLDENLTKSIAAMKTIISKIFFGQFSRKNCAKTSRKLRESVVAGVVRSLHKTSRKQIRDFSLRKEIFEIQINWDTNRLPCLAQQGLRITFNNDFKF